MKLGMSKGLVGVGTATAILLAAPQIAMAQAGAPGEPAAAPQSAPVQPASYKGIISRRDGPRITVSAPDGTQTVILVTERTKVVATAGAIGLQRNEMQGSDLIKGLPVSIDAAPMGAELEALTVTFKSSDLKTARQVEAGTSQLQQENAELRKRMSEANQYVQKAETTVLFASGSAQISAQGKADLQAIAAKAKGVKGYMISVIGYADTTGTAEANQRLSARRAQAVIAYLQKHTGVMPQRVMAGDAMGDVHQIGDTRSAAGLAQNRRVVVKVLTNKGLEGM